MELPGLGIDSAQQIIAEIGPQAAAFPSAAQLASWVGVCPGTPGECWRIQQRSLSERQPFHASAAQLTRSCCGQETRLPAPDCFPTPIFASGLRQSGLGHCSPPLPADLEDSSCGRCLCRIRTGTHADCIKEKATEARDTTEETGIPGTAHPGDTGRRNRVIFEGVRGAEERSSPLSRSFHDFGLHRRLPLL